MKTDSILNKNQVIGLAAYAAVLPASLLLEPHVGSWLFVAGSLISLPLTPIGFVAFWAAINFGEVAAFFTTWAVNFFQGWLMLAPYIAKNKRQGKKAKPLMRFSIPIITAIAAMIVVLATLAQF